MYKFFLFVRATSSFLVCQPPVSSDHWPAWVRWSECQAGRLMHNVHKYLILGHAVLSNLWVHDWNSNALDQNSGLGSFHYTTNCSLKQAELISQTAEIPRIHERSHKFYVSWTRFMGRYATLWPIGSVCGAQQREECTASFKTPIQCWNSIKMSIITAIFGSKTLQEPEAL